MGNSMIAHAALLHIVLPCNLHLRWVGLLGSPSHRRYTVCCPFIRRLLWHIVVGLMNLVLAVTVDQTADARLRDEAQIIADKDVQ